VSPRLLRAAPLGAVLAVLLSASVAQAVPNRSPMGKYGGLPLISDGPSFGIGQGTGAASSAFALNQQHGGSLNHLDPVRKNMELVGKVRMNTPGDAATPNQLNLGVAPGQIADVAVYKDTAYLNSWSLPYAPEYGTCLRGGFFTVDISNPARPQQLGFVPASLGTYHGEGAHVITFPDGRDVLAVNNERCDDPEAELPMEIAGGFDLYDVSDPANPEALVLSAGDYGPVGELVCCGPEAQGANSQFAHDYHSVFMWRDGAKVYLIGVDNAEQARTDVDIFDITDPTNPVAVEEFD